MLCHREGDELTRYDRFSLEDCILASTLLGRRPGGVLFSFAPHCLRGVSFHGTRCILLLSLG